MTHSDIFVFNHFEKFGKMLLRHIWKQGSPLADSACVKLGYFRIDRPV